MRAILRLEENSHLFQVSHPWFHLTTLAILLVPGQFLEMPGAIYYGYFLGFGCLVLIGLFGELFSGQSCPRKPTVEQKKRKIPVAD
jgi:asparagine N-glycosylation enzyme membrane subunit Stt3